MKTIQQMTFIIFLIFSTSCSQNSKYSIRTIGETLFIAHNEVDIKNSIAQDFYNKGINYRNNGNHKNSLKYFLKADSIEPENITINNSIALAHCRNNDIVNSISWFERSLLIDSTNIPTYSAYGWTLNQFNEFDQAIMVMNVGLKINQTDPIPGILFANISTSYYQKGECEIALEYINKAINKGDDDILIESFNEFKETIESSCSKI